MKTPTHEDILDAIEDVSKELETHTKLQKDKDAHLREIIAYRNKQLDERWSVNGDKLDAIISTQHIHSEQLNEQSKRLLVVERTVNWRSAVWWTVAKFTGAVTLAVGAGAWLFDKWGSLTKHFHD